MFPIESFVTFTAAAAILTITPGLDTALVLRTSASEGPGRALLVGLGIAAGCFAWGLLVAAGLGALLAASEAAYIALRWIGAGYLVYLGVKMLRSSRQGLGEEDGERNPTSRRSASFGRGFLTNILNPKVGVFYVSFLPQFIPPDADVPLMTIALTTIHAVLGLIWFVLLISATRPISRFLRKSGVVTRLDQITGALFIGFGIRLALAERR
jgi:threonine/homoserine/homoserine lactone efflux protein